MSIVEVRVPELGDSKGVAVVDVLIAKGARIHVDDPLITLESEKASMDVPSPVSGVVDSVAVKKGDEVSAGALIATVEVAETAAAKLPAAVSAAGSERSAAAAGSSSAAEQGTAAAAPAVTAQGSAATRILGRGRTRTGRVASLGCRDNSFRILDIGSGAGEGGSFGTAGSRGSRRPRRRSRRLHRGL